MALWRPRLRADADFVNAQLGVDEGYLLAFIDGQSTVEELRAQTRLSEPEIKHALRNLIAAQLVVEPELFEASEEGAADPFPEDDVPDLVDESWEDESQVNLEIDAVLSALEPVDGAESVDAARASSPVLDRALGGAPDLVDVTSIEAVDDWEDDGSTLVGVLPNLDALEAGLSPGVETFDDLFDDKTPETPFEHGQADHFDADIVREDAKSDFEDLPSTEIAFDLNPGPEPSSTQGSEAPPQDHAGDDWDDRTPVTGMQIQPSEEELGPVADADAIAREIAAHDDAWEHAAAAQDPLPAHPVADVDSGEFDDEPETSNIHEGTVNSGGAIFFDGAGNDEDEIVLYNSAVDHEFGDADGDAAREHVAGSGLVFDSSADDEQAEPPALEIEVLEPPIVEPPSREEYPFMSIELAAGLLPVDVLDFYGALTQTPWRDRVAAASRVEGAELLAYCLDPDPNVAELVYKNMLFNPELACFVALHQQTPEALARLGTHERFVVEPQVCINLLRNPACPESTLAQVVSTFNQQQLQQIATSPDASEQARVVAARALGRLFAQALPGDRCAMILGTQARCLLELPGAELDEDTEELLCRARFDSVELILNLVRFAGATLRLLQILYRQPLTMETAEIKEAIRQHANWPR